MFLLLCLLIPAFAFPQGITRTDVETILPEQMIKAVLNEVSGQLAFNNEVRLAGYNRIRGEEEFKSHFFESAYLAKKLREYEVDEVRLEDLGKYLPERKEWWIRENAELWMIEPEMKRLSRLAEHPALMAYRCDAGEWQGEVVYLDRRDISKLKDMDLTGKIILTPEYSNRFPPAFEKGALGVVSYSTLEKPPYDPFQVIFNMGMRGKKTQNNVFCFQIWPYLGEQLKGMIFDRQKVVLRASAKTKKYPYKLDTILATIKGKDPQKKGLMFTAHLFERPLKQGANDNISGSVTLVEIARTIARLIKEGKIERPERSIFFLLIEEGSGTMAFFRKYPEMAHRILAVINMDMVGENLEENHGFFNIEKPLYSKTSFIESVTVNTTHYVFETNIERVEDQMSIFEGQSPITILEKNGTRQPFRFLVNRYVGGSDHGIFNEAKPGIPAVSFSVWPDHWIHTDKDRPDKSDPTQLKRTAFIGTVSALAVCSGSEEILEKLIGVTYEYRLAFIRETLSRSIKDLSLLNAKNGGSDGGIAFANGVNYIEQAAALSKKALAGIKDLTRDKKKIGEYLDNVIKSIDNLPSYYIKILENHYKNVAKLKGFTPGFAKPSVEEEKMKHIVPVIIEPAKLGKRFPYSRIIGAIRKDREIRKRLYKTYGFYYLSYLTELYHFIDGKRRLAGIRNLLSFEFGPLPAADFMKVINCLEKEKIITVYK